jgi:hypothetical protein
MNITLDVEMSTSTDNVNIATDATVWCFVTYTDSIIAHFGVHLKSSNRVTGKVLFEFHEIEKKKKKLLTVYSMVTRRHVN